MKFDRIFFLNIIVNKEYILPPKTKKEMKISKKTLLAISGLLSISALWLMFASASDRDLFMDIHNAVQHINEVNVISTWNDTTTARLSNSYGLVRIDTNNFILWETWDKKNIITDKVNGSSILWWENNRIGWWYNVILGWSGNKVWWSSNTILWWEWNNVNARTCWSYNTIIWWKNNIISGWTSTKNNCINITDQSESSVIIWGHDNNLHGRFSVVMWNNSSVKWNNSVALWSWSHIQANNSFLWTDGNSPETLETNDVFVIMAQNWAVINTNKAHSFAKLTLWWPLVLSNNNSQSDDIQCGWWQWWGIIKMKKSENNQLCLCSCDGSGWNSMFSYWACSQVCNKSIEPPICGSVDRICPYRIMYSWNCINWKVIEWTWAYFVDKNDIVHRSCQTSDGQVASCSGTVSQDMQHRQNCMDYIWVCTAGGWYDNNWHLCDSTINCPDGYEEKNWVCKPYGGCVNEKGNYNENNNKTMEWFKQPSNRSFERYLPIGQNWKWKCVSDRDPIGHKCEFSCDEDAGYECGRLNTWSVTLTNVVATCVHKTSCYNDYLFYDWSAGIYGSITYDRHRHWRVYKNPTSDNTIFQYSSSTWWLVGQEWCFIVCDPWYHEEPNPNSTYNKGWYCMPNCKDMRRTTAEDWGAYISSIWWWTPWTRRTWQYKSPSEYNEINKSDEKGIGPENSCIWTCKSGSTPIYFKGKVLDGWQKHAYTIDGELIPEFDDFLKDPWYAMDDSPYSVCRTWCKSNQFFEGFRCRSLNAYPWYTWDSSKTVTYAGITNIVGKKKLCNEDEDRMIDYNHPQNGCISTSISKESICIKKNDTDVPSWLWPRYYRIDNKCMSCPIWQHYITSTNSCQDCTDNEPDCVRDLWS